MPSGELWLCYKTVCVCSCIISCYFHLCVGLHFWDTRRYCSLVSHILTLQLFSPPRSPICLSPLLPDQPPECCRYDGKWCVSVCLDRQPEKRPLSEARAWIWTVDWNAWHGPSAWGSLEWAQLFPHETALHCSIHCIKKLELSLWHSQA